MDQCRKRIHRLTIQHDIQFDQFRGTETVRMIIERRISFRNTFQAVIEVNHNFPQRHIVIYLHPVAGNIFLFKQFPALAQTERHDRTYIIGRCNNRRFDIRFFNVIYQRRIRHTTGVMHLLHIALLIIYIVRYVRHRSNHIHIKLTVKTFLHNLHVKQPEKTATETEAQRQR